MDFSLSDEQRMLQQSLSRLLESECALDRVRLHAQSDNTMMHELWRQLADLGIPGTIIPEQYGGVGLGFLDAALVSESLGGRVSPVPFVASSVMAPVALLSAGSDGQKDTWLPRLATGDAVCGIGITERIARREGDGIVEANGTLTGKAMFVLDGVEADVLIIAGSQDRLYLVDNRSAQLQSRTLHTIDRTRCVTETVLNEVPAELLPGSAADSEPLLKMIDAGRVMLAADTLGAAQQMLDQSISYARERKQFNRVIGSFQAVKHMCAEMAAELEPCRSLVWYSAHAMSAIPDESRLMACHAKSHLAEIGQFVARTSTEVHGGMGFTDLLGLHYWFKRIGFNRQLLGAPELVRDQAAKVQGWVQTP